MADSNVEKGSITAHARTYDGVISLLKWGALAAGMIAALVVWLISR